MQRTSNIQKGQGRFRVGRIVKFRDGVPAGQISAMFENNFVVTNEERNVQLAFPYRSVSSFRDNILTLRLNSRFKTLLWHKS